MKVIFKYYDNFGLFVNGNAEKRVGNVPHPSHSGAAEKGKAPVFKEVNKKELAEKVKEKVKALLKKNYILNLSFHEKAKVYVIKIIDPSTNQVVREMPLEKLLDMVVSMEEAVEKKLEHHQNASGLGLKEKGE